MAPSVLHDQLRFRTPISVQQPGIGAECDAAHRWRLRVQTSAAARQRWSQIVYLRRRQGTGMLKRLCALRRWRPHRPLLPSLALIVALCFAFAEPLACILHCQLYVPWLLRNQHHHAHTQPANVHMALGGWAAPVQGHTLAAAAPADAAQWCVYAARQPLAPGVLVPPSPIHELVLVLALSLGALARLLFLPWREPQLHPAGGIAPPTPPPRQVFLLHSPAR